MSFDPKLFDELLKDYKTPEDSYGDGEPINNFV